MANGKLEALLAEWRQKRLLILGLGGQQPAPGQAAAGSRVPGYGLRPDGPGEAGPGGPGPGGAGTGAPAGSGVSGEFGGGCGVSHPGDASGKSGPGGAAPPGGGGDLGDGDIFQVCPCPVIAVTGSDGKTTTTTLLAEMLRAAGKTVWVGGNIGKPLLPEVGRMAPSDWAVVELSSFQLMDMDRSGHIAVVTNLAPNHLDVHKDMAEYVEAKEHVFAYQSEGDILF